MDDWQNEIPDTGKNNRLAPDQDSIISRIKALGSILQVESDAVVYPVLPPDPRLDSTTRSEEVQECLKDLKAPY